MYSGIEGRVHSREKINMALAYTNRNADFYSETRLNDLSKGGMSFASDFPLQPGTDIFIELKDSLTAHGWIHPNNQYLAEVKWCRKNLNVETPSYNIGVKYYEKFWEKSYDEGLAYLDPKEWETNYIDLIQPAFKEFPNKAAFNYLGTSVTFSELNLYSNRFAQMLIAHGFEKGDVVGINLPNIPEYLIAWLGTMKAGCVFSGVSPLLSNEEMEYQLKDSEAKGLVTLDAIFAGRLVHIESNLPKLELVVAASVGGFLPAIKQMLGKLVGKIPKGKVTSLEGRSIYHFKEIINGKLFSSKMPDIDITPDDINCIQYTGGTTGSPKGAILSHRNIVANQLVLQNWIGDAFPRGSNVSLSGFPFFHTAGLYFNMVCINMGYTQILIPNPRDTDHICEAIKKFRPSILVNVPTLYQMLIDNPKFKMLDHSNLQMCFSGASPFPKESQTELESIIGKEKLLEVYGMTETSPLITANPYQKQKRLGTIGLPLVHTDVKLLDPETNDEVPVGEPGEICVKGPQVMIGYFKKPEETKNSFTPDGYLRTGDVAVFDKDGYLTIVDRVKDMLLVGGFNVYSKKIEDTLAECKPVEMIAIIGKPNPDRPGSEIVKAFVTINPEYSYDGHQDSIKEEIIGFAREKLSPYEVPKIIEIRDELPLTAVGKIDKKQLRKSEEEDK